MTERARTRQREKGERRESRREGREIEHVDKLYL